LLAVEACALPVNIKGMAAIFTYGFDVAEQNFKNIDLYTLSNYHLLNLAVAKSYITEKKNKP
jgi:orotate phosphoribosyltransferase